MRSLLFALLAGLIVAIGCSAQSTPVGTIAALSPESDPTATDSETDVLIIDVRSKSEWDAGHLAQAVHIPHTEIADRIGELTAHKDATIVLYCAVGGRAGKAKQALEQLGFTNVENGGGYDDVRARFE